MGLDLLDVVFRVEERFGVPVADDDFQRIVRDGDIVVGDFYALILRRVHARDTVRQDVHLNFALWEDLREQLGAAAGVPAGEILLKTPLETLFPAGGRRVAWDKLRAASRYRIAKLDYPPLVRPISFSLALAMALLEQFPIWRVPQAQWLWPLLGLIGIWVFAETYGKAMVVFAVWRVRFPGGMRSVKDLARSLVATEYEAILADSPRARDLPAEDRCLAIWEEFREVLADALGVNVDAITPKSRLFGDLGAS